MQAATTIVQINRPSGVNEKTVRLINFSCQKYNKRITNIFRRRLTNDFNRSKNWLINKKKQKLENISKRRIF